MMKTKYFTQISFFILSVFICISSLKASLPAGYTEHYVDDIKYGIFVPTDYNASQKYALIIFLHGYSDLTAWDLEYYHEAFQSKYPAIILTPKCPTSLYDGWGFSWNGTPSHAMSKTLKLMDSIVNTYNIDTCKMYVHGTSMGGFGTYCALAAKPGKFAAAYVVCGGGNTATANVIMKTPLWIFHGSADPVVPVSNARNMFSSLLSLNDKQVRYTEYPGVQHDSWNNVGRETTLSTWMMSQVKGISHTLASDTISNLNLSLVNNIQVNLQWQKPANDTCLDKTVWYYKVFRNGQLLACVNGADNNSYTDTQTSENTEYSYQIVAVNYFFIESALSSPLTIQTQNRPTIAQQTPDSNNNFQLYPNPVKTSATISFTNHTTGLVSVKLYDLMGHELETITNDIFTSGFQTLSWNKGSLPNGIYLLVLKTNNQIQTMRLIIN